MNNRELYESDEVVKKYTGNSTRTRCLNESEKNFIDKFDIKNKKVLVLGSGSGRVPANLLLFGNTVFGIELSKQLSQAANKIFPAADFRRMSLEQGDATDLSHIEDRSFDVVFFPQNGIDYIPTKEARDVALKEMTKKIKPGGLLAFSSHNKLAYLFSPKLRFNNHHISGCSLPYFYKQEKVVGGGVIFKGNPRFIISDTEHITGAVFTGFACDTRNTFDRLIARNLSLAQWYFPYILFVFKKL